jgi:hypothetical protein
VLNEINHSDRCRYPLMNPAKPGKVLERIASGPDKITILVGGRGCGGVGGWVADGRAGGREHEDIGPAGRQST